MSQGGTISPINPLPPVVAALFLVILGIEVVVSLGSRGVIGGPQAVGWRLLLMQNYAFSGDIFDWMLQQGRWPAQHVIRFFSFPFIHASFTHALFAGVILLAMGKMTAERFGAIAMLAIFVLSGAGGALAYALLLNDPVPLVGAFPNVYGLIGAFTFMLWRSLSTIGANQARAFTLIGFLMGFQLLFGLLFGAQNDWVADLAGFATGFVLSFVLAPGGWSGLRGRIRRD
ncbi:MAG: rhomboid family intramembrane serine protease [Rhodobacteraceae bacterium]|nr:rhomboid family intramembrane serine protease [Paracoccaceae bacterium]